MAELALEHEVKQKLVVLAAMFVACLGFVLMAISIAGQNVLLLLALLGALGFMIAFPFPRMAIVVVILFAQVQYLFTSYYGVLVTRPILPVAFQWLDEVILLSLLSNLVLTKLLRKDGLEKAPALMLLAVLFVIGIVSARLNNIPLLRGLIGERYVFEMVIVYLAVINMDLSERYLKGLIYLMLGIGAFQAIVGILEFIGKYRLYMAGNHDIVQGTWGGGSANHIGIFFLCLGIIVLARLRRGWHGPRVILLGLFAFLMVLCSCRTAIVIAPFLFLFVLRERMKNPKYWIATVAVFIFLAATLVFYYSNTDADVTRDLGADAFLFQVAERTRVIPVMSQALRDNSALPLFGTGPGTYLTPTGTFYGSKVYMQVASMMRTQELIQPFVSASYAVVWMEYGAAGLILFGLVLARLLLFSLHQERVADSLFWKDYFRALQAIILVYAVVGGIFAIWTHFQTSIYLWLFPAIGVRYVVLRRQEASRATEVAAERDGARTPLLPAPAGHGSLTN
jgi:hypothetical protein